METTRIIRKRIQQSAPCDDDVVITEIYQHNRLAKCTRTANFLANLYTKIVGESGAVYMISMTTVDMTGIPVRVVMYMRARF